MAGPDFVEDRFYRPAERLSTDRVVDTPEVDPTPPEC
jgi:hypothetical protein